MHSQTARLYYRNSTVTGGGDRVKQFAGWWVEIVTVGGGVAFEKSQLSHLLAAARSLTQQLARKNRQHLRSRYNLKETE